MASASMADEPVLNHTAIFADVMQAFPRHAICTILRDSAFGSEIGRRSSGEGNDAKPRVNGSFLSQGEFCGLFRKTRGPHFCQKCLIPHLNADFEMNSSLQCHDFIHFLQYARFLFHVGAFPSVSVNSGYSRA